MVGSNLPFLMRILGKEGFCVAAQYQLGEFSEVHTLPATTKLAQEVYNLL